MVSSSDRLGVNDTHQLHINDLTAKTVGIERERNGKTESVPVPRPYRGPYPGGSVYFISDGEYIKIGSSERVGRRFKSLQSGNPKKLELLGAVSAKLFSEYGLHRRFADIRVHGEWFKHTPELMAFIEEAIQTPEPEPDDLPSMIEAFTRWHKVNKGKLPAPFAAYAGHIAFWTIMLKNGATSERLAGLADGLRLYERALNRFGNNAPAELRWAGRVSHPPRPNRTEPSGLRVHRAHEKGC